MQKAAAAAFLTLSLAVLPLAGHAQFGQTAQRLNQLQSDVNYLAQLIQQLQQHVSQGSGSDAATLGAMEVRLAALETEMRGLTGQVEEMRFRQQQAVREQEVFQRQLEQRLSDIETAMAGAGVDPLVRDSLPVAEVSNTATLSAADNGGAQTTTAGAGNSGFDPYTASVNAGGAITLGAQTEGENDPEYKAALAAFQAGDFDEAEVSFRQFLVNNPTGALAGNASYWIGESHYARADYTKAAIQFAEGYRNYRNSPKAADHLFKLALSLKELERRQEACGTFALLQNQFRLTHADLTARGEAEALMLGCS